MRSHDTEEIFPEEGWRDPGDDASRLACYVLCVFGFLAALPGAVYLGILALSPSKIEAEFDRPYQSADPYLFGGMAVTCAIMACAAAWFLAKESRHWRLRDLTADKVVAGIFVLSIAFGIIGVWMLEGGGPSGSVPAMGFMLAIALGIFVSGLVFGLAIAGYQALARKARKLGHAKIVSRYAVDDKLQRIDAHPCPAEDALVAIVEVEFIDGEIAQLTASSAAYEMAKPGASGLAFGTRKKLTRFKPLG